MPSIDLPFLDYSQPISQSDVGEEWIVCHGQSPLVELTRCTGQDAQKVVFAHIVEQLGKGAKGLLSFRKGLLPRSN